MTKPQSHGREAIQPVKRAPEAQAEGFAIVRQAHESEMAEDYVELIAELIETRGEARPVEIAERLGVKPLAVVRSRGEEARQQVAVRHVQLEHIEARLDRPPGGGDEVLEQRVHVAAVHGARGGPVGAEGRGARTQGRPGALLQGRVALPGGAARGLAPGVPEPPFLIVIASISPFTPTLVTASAPEPTDGDTYSIERMWKVS